MTESLVQNKENNWFKKYRNSFYFYVFIYLGIISIIGMIIALILGFVLKNNGIIYSWLINLPFLVIAGIINSLIDVITFKIIKETRNKMLLYFIVILFRILTIFIIGGGMIIGFSVNHAIKPHLFEEITLVIGVIIYAIAIFIASIHFNHLNRD